ncbi:unnamed protein product [Lactuca saligna]|uniref:Uncharacterized protein n=1 Tax=Lactuca saligna TaxID=75948 RepID=A0AA35YMZ9_LACSI|nr:unnamed protein product [Lactuca saligna]
MRFNRISMHCARMNQHIPMLYVQLYTYQVYAIMILVQKKLVRLRYSLIYIDLVTDILICEHHFCFYSTLEYPGSHILAGGSSNGKCVKKRTHGSHYSGVTDGSFSGVKALRKL